MAEALQQAMAAADALGVETASAVVQVSVAPITGWRNFPSQSIPQGFCHGNIYHYIIETAILRSTVYDCDCDGEDGLYYGTSNSFRNTQWRAKVN